MPRFQAVWGSNENRQHCPAILADLCNNFDLAINPDDLRPFMIPTEDLPVDFLAYAHQLFRQNMAKIEPTQRYETLHQAIERMQSARDKAARDQLTQYAKTRQQHLRKMKKFIRWYLESFDGWGTYRWGGKIMGTDARLEYLKVGLLVQVRQDIAHQLLQLLCVLLSMMRSVFLFSC